MAITAGMYELRTMLQTSMVVTGSGYTPVTGSNVFLYSSNDGNNRKWRFTQNSAGRWRLQNAANGLYMTLGVNVPVQGANVRQWTSSSNAIQYWNIIETGNTVTLDGYVCPIVKLGNYYDGAGTTWMLDVDGAMTTNSANIEVNRSTSATSQTFALLPTALGSNSFPVPASLGWAARTNVNPYRTHAGAGATAMYLGWRCPDTWVPNASKGFERRVRIRYMSAETSSWGSWGSWSVWQDVNPLMRDAYCYDLNTVDASFDMSTYKAKEVQAEVRAKTSTTHGQTVSNTLRNIVDPAATFASDGATEEGFKVDVTTDYTPAYYTLKSLKLDGEELLSYPVDFKMLGQSESFVIPWESLASLGGLPEQGAQATAYYSRSTDLFVNIGGGGTRSTTLEITYGEEAATEPTFTETEGRLFDVSHPQGVSGVWIAYDGQVYYDGDGTGVAYPFGEGARMLVVLGDGSVYNGPVPEMDGKPCHAWSWDGGHFLLEVVDGFMETERSFKANTSTFQLNNREWESVKFSDTLSGDYSAEGALKDGLTSSNKADLMALMKAHHATYRAPSGEMAKVGITDIQYSTMNGTTRVSVGMTQVTP